MKNVVCEETDHGAAKKNGKLKNLSIQKLQCFDLRTEITGISFGRSWAAGFDQSMDYSKCEFHRKDDRSWNNRRIDCLGFL
jgi:hypothetical protein